MAESVPRDYVVTTHHVAVYVDSAELEPTERSFHNFLLRVIHFDHL